MYNIIYNQQILIIMTSYLYLEFDNKVLSINKTLCEQNEYLNSIKHNETNRNKPFFVDRNYELANEIISAYRYNDLNLLSEEGLYELEIWNDTNVYDESNSQVIELEVGGQMFKTTKGTLSKCSYYYTLFDVLNNVSSTDANQLNKSDLEPLDMNPEAFKQILNYARNKKYKLDIDKYHREIIYQNVDEKTLYFSRGMIVNIKLFSKFHFENTLLCYKLIFYKYINI